MPFGKYKGSELKDIRPSYLLFLHAEMKGHNQTDSALYRYIDKNLEVLNNRKRKEE